MVKSNDNPMFKDPSSMSEEEKEAYITELLALTEALKYEKRLLKAENEMLGKDHRAEIDKLIKGHERETEKLIEMIRISNARYWGAKSERTFPHQLALFNETEAESDESNEPSIEEVLSSKARKAKRKISLDLSKSDLPRVIIEHELSDDDRICDTCGTVLDEMKVETTYKLRMIPAHFEIEEHRRHVYLCKPCASANAQGEEVTALIRRAPTPTPPIDRSFATPTLIAAIIHDKYTRSLPLYRIEQEISPTGKIAIGRNTMSNWMMSVANKWFSPLYDHMKQHLLGCEVLFADETTVNVLKEPKRKPTSKGYMWVWSTGECDIPITLFDYSPSRAAQVPKDFLGDKTDFYLHCDGYQAYNGIDPGIITVGCLAHVRRKFTDIVKAIGADKARGGIAYAAVEKLDRIFHIDGRMDGLDPNERKIRRDKELKVLLESFFSWVRKEQVDAVPGMALQKALQYALNQEPSVLNVLADGRLELTNNRSERCIKPFAVGRRNWLFSDTPKGARASAVLFSIVQTAIANNLKTFDYLTWVLEELPQHDLKKDPGCVERFVPWSKDVPTKCRLKPDEQPDHYQEEPVLLAPGTDIEAIERILEPVEIDLS